MQRVGIAFVLLLVVAAPLPGVSAERRLRGTVIHVDRRTGRVLVRADGREMELQYPRAEARRLKRGDRLVISVPDRQAVRMPKAPPEMRGDPGPPAAEIPPPAGYPIGPGMGPIGAGSPNAGPGSPVGADGAR